jgi:glycosyltransferase involved in cell wall biosynthesis
VKICFVGGTRYPHPLEASQRKKFRLLGSLAEVFVIGFSTDLRFRAFTDEARFYLLPRLPFAPLRYAELLTLSPFILFWLIGRHGIQVLVSQSAYEGSAAALAKKITGRFGCKVVLIIESHGDFEASVFLQRRIRLPFLYRAVMRCSVNFALRASDLSRAVSYSTREQLARWQAARPIFQFPTWTDIELFSQPAGGERDALCPHILYAGALIPRKGVHHLIEAFAGLAKEFPRARLIIVGYKENKVYANELRKRVLGLYLEERVQFAGQLSQEELAAWMRRASLFALPTYSEGLPRVVFEAMAAELPVVASAVSGVPEIIRDGVTGFTPAPGDEGELREKMLWLLRHPDEAREMGRRARRAAAEIFSAEAYRAGYRRMLDAAAARLAPLRPTTNSFEDDTEHGTEPVA